MRNIDIIDASIKKVHYIRPHSSFLFLSIVVYFGEILNALKLYR